MKNKFKLLTAFLAIILTLFIGVGASVSAASVDMDEIITEEVNDLVDAGTLESWHTKYVSKDGYQAYYYKMRYLNGNFDAFCKETEAQINTHINWYKSQQSETWDYILDNLDIEPEYLEKDKYIGLYWDSVSDNTVNNGYMYLIWTSSYSPSEFVTLTQFKESGNTYKLYDNDAAMDNLEMNWLDSTYYHFIDYNLTIHITPIGGFDSGKQFGIELKDSYSFEGFTYGMDQGQYSKDMDPNSYFSGSCSESVTFNFTQAPAQDGVNMMQLCTHAYDYVTDCEVQSYYDLNFGGYIHAVHFNLSIDPDEIYRVDTSYTISNSNKKWYEFWKPDDSHSIKKSLTPDKASGGFLGLTNYYGFKEGSFSAVSNSSKTYKYELILDYDDNGWAWKIFTGQEYKESDYQKVDEFKILRINYLLDDQVYDVAIKMDTIEGGTYNILDSDLIEDESSTLHEAKTWLQNLNDTIESKWNSYKWIFFTTLGVAGGILLLFLVIKIKSAFNVLMSDPRSSGGSTCKKNKKE